MPGIDVSPFAMAVALGVAIAAVTMLFTGRACIAADPSDQNVTSAEQPRTDRRRRSAARGTWDGLFVAVVPLVAVPIAFSGATNLLWLLLVASLVAGLAAAALTALRRVHRRRKDAWVAGPAAAAALALLVLLEFHWLLVVRLSVVPNPQSLAPAAFSAEAWEAGGSAILLPAVMLCALLVVAANVAWWRRLTAWLGSVRWLRRLRRPELPEPSRWRRKIALGALLLFLAYFLPYFGGAQFPVLAIATYEYGKVLYLWLLAVVLARYVVNADIGFRPARPVYRDPRVLVPIGLFLLVAAASVVRHDLGPLIPVFVGTLSMSWCALRDESLRRTLTGRPDAASRVAQLRAGRTWLRDLRLPLIAGLIFVGAALSTDYVQVRLEVNRDAWQYAWGTECVPPPEGIRPPGPTAAGAYCLLSQLSVEASKRSQIAKADAAIADGGLWGRGLTDVQSSVVPLGSTDLVLAVIWNKLGGLVLLELGALLALLAAALSRAVWTLRADRDGYATLHPAPDRSLLFAGGLAAVVLGQFVFVLAATVNWVPHSGITAPFLSRAGHSTVALAGGLIVALVVAYADNPRAGASATTSSRVPPIRPTVRGPVLVTVVTLVGLVGALLLPYGGYAEDRRFCGPADGPVVDPTTCNTDRIPLRRATVEVDLPDGSHFVRRQDGGWRAAGAGPAPDGLGGILTAPDSPAAGLAELALPEVFTGAAPTTLGDRLTPHPQVVPPVGSAELVLQPKLQQAALDALSKPGTATAPTLAGGLVLLDASTGYVLAAASVPGRVSAPTADPGDAGAAKPGMASPVGLPQPDGSIVASPICTIKPHIRDNDPRCAQWVPSGRDTAADRAAQKAEDERYIGGGPGITLPEGRPRPDPAVDRAMGRRYGFGSTFKIVVAAAFLRGDPTADADTEIDAPSRVVLPNGVVIDNFGGGTTSGGVACPQSSNQRITLRMALAVSCNTAFVALLQRIGWPAVRDTAVDLGFAVDAPPDHPAGLADSGYGTASTVPATVAPSGLGNAALGGGNLSGTPLQMAAVMAAIADDGQAVQPTLASAIQTVGAPVRVPVDQTRTHPLPLDVAHRLRDALDATADSRCRGCTDRLLRTPPGHPVWVKTGTHDVRAGVDPSTISPDAFVAEYSWQAGFMETKAGPVAFALVLEAGTQSGSGGNRARDVLASVLSAVVAQRG